jgi:hypothetical protein
VVHELATRDRSFLTVVEQAIYGHPKSPYLALLRHAGIDLGDVAAVVASDGVEGALQTLVRAGVYVTYDELRGRSPAIRGSRRFQFRASDFDNPHFPPHLIRYTAGSGGRPGRIGYPLAFVQERAAVFAVIEAAHGIQNPVHAFWQPAPLVQFVICAMIGQRVISWFYPAHPLPVLARMAARYLAVVGRLGGCRFPAPQRCDLDAPEQLVVWLTARLRHGGPMVLWTMSSAAARLGLAASAVGASLEELTCYVSGEPLTDLRRRQIEASGARVIVGYAANEMSGLALSCATPTSSDDVHLMSNRFAVVERPRAVTEGGPIVDALMFTLLTPAATKIALNAELGDTARVEERDCGCLLGQLGMRIHLSDIRSFEKLTGEGVTFARSNLEQILEEVLPARFGGTGHDYQLAEEEAPDGVTRLILRVSPNVGVVDDERLRTVLTEEIGRGGRQDHYHIRMWERVGTLDIRRERPLPTRGGKVLPFQLFRRPGDGRREA